MHAQLDNEKVICFLLASFYLLSVTLYEEMVVNNWFIQMVSRSMHSVMIETIICVQLIVSLLMLSFLPLSTLCLLLISNLRRASLPPPATLLGSTSFCSGSQQQLVVTLCMPVNFHIMTKKTNCVCSKQEEQCSRLPKTSLKETCTLVHD